MKPRFRQVRIGEVCRARDTRLEGIVAIKILPSHLCGDPETKQHFEREARSISSLSHPHICTLHDIGSHDGSSYLTLELAIFLYSMSEYE